MSTTTNQNNINTYIDFVLRRHLKKCLRCLRPPGYPVVTGQGRYAWTRLDMDRMNMRWNEGKTSLLAQLALEGQIRPFAGHTWHYRPRFQVSNADLASDGGHRVDVFFGRHLMVISNSARNKIGRHGRVFEWFDGVTMCLRTWFIAPRIRLLPIAGRWRFRQRRSIAAE
jgi:hypothetical protein